MGGVCGCPRHLRRKFHSSTITRLTSLTYMVQMLAKAIRAHNMETSRDRAKGDVGKTGEDGVGGDDLHEAGVDDLHEAGVDDLHEVGLDELHEVGVDGRQATEASRHEDGLREKGWSEKWSWERWFKFGKNRPKALKVFKTRTASLV